MFGMVSAAACAEAVVIAMPPKKNARSKKPANPIGKKSPAKRKEDNKFAKAISSLINKSLDGEATVPNRAIFCTSAGGGGVHTEYFWLPSMEDQFVPLYQKQYPGKEPPGTAPVEGGSFLMDMVDASKFTREELLLMQDNLPVVYVNKGRGALQFRRADARGGLRRLKLHNEFNERQGGGGAPQSVFT